MLAQVLWRQIVYQYKHLDKVERGSIPQGTVVFVADTTDKSSTVIYNDMVLVVSKDALWAVESEKDVFTPEELRDKFHNNRSSPCLLK